MKHERRIPAWLLRDLPALAGMFACFWLFVIPLITEGFRLIRGGKPMQDKCDHLAYLLLNAEATLAFALWREAYRRLGYNPRDVQLSLADLPADNLALMARIRSYMDQVQNLSRASAHYTEVLRQRWGGGCPLRRAARATLFVETLVDWSVFPGLSAWRTTARPTTRRRERSHLSRFGLWGSRLAAGVHLTRMVAGTAR